MNQPNPYEGSNVVPIHDNLADNIPRTPLKSGDGNGTYDGMDGWQTSVEARLGELKIEVRSLRDEARVDFRLLFAAIIAVALGLAGLLAKGFHWL